MPICCSHLRICVDVLTQLANVHWGLWALYQSKVSENRFKFDYLKYAKERFLAFYHHKDRVYAEIAKRKLEGRL